MTKMKKKYENYAHIMDRQTIVIKMTETVVRNSNRREPTSIHV